MKYELGFIGAGNMAEAIARAAIDHCVVAADRITAADPIDERQKMFSGLGIVISDDNGQVIAHSSHVLLAVKPQTLAALAEHLRAVDENDQVIISIMAGISTSRIEEAVGRSARVVRVMPNTPLMTGVGMAGVALGTSARPGDESLAMRLFSAAGKAIMVDESDLDAITAVSGSGPAYVFYLAEAMAAAAAELGLAKQADVIVEQTIRGAAMLMSQSDDSPTELRQKVTSPGGTTEAAIKHFDANSTRQVIVNAIKAARDRSIKLGG